MGERKLWAGSLYGSRLRRGLVQLSEFDEMDKPTWHITLTPDEARAHAYAILEAAEAATYDELIMEWLTKEVGTKVEQAAGLLGEFRRRRDARLPRHRLGVTTRPVDDSTN